LNPNASAKFAGEFFIAGFQHPMNRFGFFSKKKPRASPASQKDFARGVSISWPGQARGLHVLNWGGGPTALVEGQRGSQ